MMGPLPQSALKNTYCIIFYIIYTYKNNDDDDTTIFRNDSIATTYAVREHGYIF